MKNIASRLNATRALINAILPAFHGERQKFMRDHCVMGVNLAPGRTEAIANARSDV
jgi:hypothetical protein